MRELRWLAPGLLLLLSGCPIDSPVPLPEGARRPVDQRLIGAWTCRSGSEEKPVELTISKADGGIVLEGRDAEDPGRVSGFVASVAGRGVLCIREEKDSQDRPWMAMGYRLLPGGELRLAVYDDGGDKRRDPPIATGEEFERVLAALPDPTQGPDEDVVVCRRR